MTQTSFPHVQALDFNPGDQTLLALKRDVASSGREAWLFWQDPTFIGFAKVLDDRVDIQPEGPAGLEFALLRDFRLFGDAGEWHVWRTGQGRYAGRLRPAAPSPDFPCFDESHYLWGTAVCSETETVSGWTCVTEDRGMRIWLPWSPAGNVPPALKVRQFIDRDPDTGLAGIVDAMLMK